MSGKGAYYKEKYGGGGRGSRGGGKGGKGGGKGYGKGKRGWSDSDDSGLASYGGGGGGRGGGSSRGGVYGGLGDATAGGVSELRDELRRIDGRPYPAYRDIEGRPFNIDGVFTLVVQHCQSDPFAPPSRCFVRVPRHRASFPETCFSPPERQVALRDYLTRRFADAAREAGADVRTESGGWSGGKGGELTIDAPGQHVLERSAVVVDADAIEARFTVALPAQGRSIMGEWAAQILTETVPRLVESALLYASCPAAGLCAHLDSVEDQQSARRQLSGLGLLAFVGDGAVLPRASGASDAPMASPPARPFAAPETMRVALTLPHRGEVSGMGIRRGVTLIVGGGFHGKSTLLQAVQLGVYDKVPGDGRELVVTDINALKIRAEDGRAVTRCDISAFIDQLPFGRDTRDFSTEDASGSTSQAAAIVEAIEAGCTALLLDEDTCATNFMIRDERMQRLVSPDKEPIRPFISRVRPLWEDARISTLMVVGGAGDFFDVADAVIMMDCYAASDVTEQAKEIAQAMPVQRGPPPPAGIFAAIPMRCPKPSQLGLGLKVAAQQRTVRFGDLAELDLSASEQLVERSQTRAIAEALQRLAEGPMDGGASVRALLVQVEEQLSARGLDALRPDWRLGTLARPRTLEVAAAINRWRALDVGARVQP